MNDMWMVLRCSSSKTADLANSLASMGLGSWIPLWQRQRRCPRTHKMQIVSTPCLPSFVFIKDQDTDAAMIARELSATPRFNLMAHMGKAIRFADIELQHLRKASAQTTATKPAPAHAIGAKVKVGSGSFAGLAGVVVATTRHYAVVQFNQGTWGPVKIPGFILMEDMGLEI